MRLLCLLSQITSKFARPVKSIASLTQNKCDINTCLDHPSVINHNDDNTLKHSRAINRKDTKQLPHPIKYSNIFTSPTEITCHGKVKLTDATVKTQTKDKFHEPCENYTDIF